MHTLCERAFISLASPTVVASLRGRGWRSSVVDYRGGMSQCLWRGRRGKQGRTCPLPPKIKKILENIFRANVIESRAFTCKCYVKFSHFGANKLSCKKSGIVNFSYIQAYFREKCLAPQSPKLNQLLRLWQKHKHNFTSQFWGYVYFSSRDYRNCGSTSQANHNFPHFSPTNVKCLTSPRLQLLLRLLLQNSMDLISKVLLRMLFQHCHTALSDIH